jgi:hypothetical protein
MAPTQGCLSQSLAFQNNPGGSGRGQRVSWTLQPGGLLGNPGSSLPPKPLPAFYCTSPEFCLPVL